MAFRRPSQQRQGNISCFRYAEVSLRYRQKPEQEQEKKAKKKEGR